MYSYEAFFSYKRDELTDEWHSQLLGRIRYWLSQELGSINVNIFFDKRSIGNGLQFDTVIAEALKRSKVLISLFSPLYFASPHCMAEVGAFIERENRLGKARGTLISCARFHDGSRYPMPFAAMQSEDFTKFAIPVGAFWESKRGEDFVEPIKKFSDEIGAKIRSAPPFSDTFPTAIYDGNSKPVPLPIKRPANYL